MKLTKLSLCNFRGFQQLDLEFSPDVTVLVGVNGAGKTSVLDAISLMLSCLINGVKNGRPEAPQLLPNDMRVGASTATIELQADLNGASTTWSLAGTLPGASENRVRPA